MEINWLWFDQMKKIIFDTNFATIPFQFKVDIYTEINRIIDEKYQIIFPRICLPELLKLKHGKAALELMKAKNVNFVDIPLIKNIDNSIVEFAKKEKALIATQDIEIKKLAKEFEIKIITLRQKKYLTFS